jgi:aspartate 1-decarboxylase
MHMRRTLLGGKIHRATVTEANVDYEGSITIDADLLEAADILPNEAVHVWSVTTGSRLTTYAIPAPRGSGVICMNGAAAHAVRAGESVIIASYVELDDDEARVWEPRVVVVDERNRIIAHRSEQAFRVARGALI